MEKILLAVKTDVPDMASIDFACYLGRLTRSGVTGVFLNNISAPHIGGRRHEKKPATQSRAQREEVTAIMDSGINLFKTWCESKKVRCEAHNEIQGPSLQMLAESRYADLIVLDPEIAFSETGKYSPASLIRNILDNSECPVVISPEHFSGIDELVFAYDRSASALFALKQFTYMFPELSGKKITVLEIINDGDSREEERKEIGHWLRDYYATIVFEQLKCGSDNEFFYYLLNKRNAMVIMGADGCSVSSLLKPRSRADMLIKGIVHPMFIAHQ